ncbi:MAG: hypothetical protein ACLQPN_15890 [Bryobacteraceae bacterium]
MNPAFSVILSAIWVVPSIGQSQQNQLIGRWRSSQVSPAGVSAIFEFHGDDQLDSYSAAISEGRYRFVGTDTILFESKNGQEKQEVEWDSQDRARIEDEAAGKSMELVRLGKIPDRENPLIGEWSTMREWNGNQYPARVLFFSDGRVVWITTLRTEHGRYSIQSKGIRLEVPGRPVLEGSFAISENRLTLPSPKGNGSYSFNRF